MEALFALGLLINAGFSGMKMGRHMTNLFMQLKKTDRQLWLELGQPGTSNMFDTAGYIRGNQILFKGSKELDNHSILSSQYNLARKWFFRFQYGSALLFALLVLTIIINKAL